MGRPPWDAPLHALQVMCALDLGGGSSYAPPKQVVPRKVLSGEMLGVVQEWTQQVLCQLEALSLPWTSLGCLFHGSYFCFPGGLGF